MTEKAQHKARCCLFPWPEANTVVAEQTTLYYVYDVLLSVDWSNRCRTGNRILGAVSVMLFPLHNTSKDTVELKNPSFQIWFGCQPRFLIRLIFVCLTFVVSQFYAYHIISWREMNHSAFRSNFHLTCEAIQVL